jgi:hypothetical protein
MRLATETQIAHFGQCPRQLFKSPHPPRSAKGRFGPRDGIHRRFTPRLLDLAPPPQWPTLPLAPAAAAEAAEAASAAATATATANAAAGANLSADAAAAAALRGPSLRALVPPNAQHVRVPSPRFAAASGRNPGGTAGWFDAAVRWRVQRRTMKTMLSLGELWQCAFFPLFYQHSRSLVPRFLYTPVYASLNSIYFLYFFGVRAVTGGRGGAAGR